MACLVEQVLEIGTFLTRLREISEASQAERLLLSSETKKKEREASHHVVFGDFIAEEGRMELETGTGQSQPKVVCYLIVADSSRQSEAVGQIVPE